MYHPHTHMEIARQRHADMVREAERQALARLVKREKPDRRNVPSLLRGLRLHRPASGPATVQPAWRLR